MSKERGTPRPSGSVCFNARNAGDAAMTTAPYANAQAVFYQQYEQVRRDEVVGILLALFLGGFGIHHFYLRRTGLGFCTPASAGPRPCAGLY